MFVTIDDTTSARGAFRLGTSAGADRVERYRTVLEYSHKHNVVVRGVLKCSML